VLLNETLDRFEGRTEVGVEGASRESLRAVFTLKSYFHEATVLRATSRTGNRASLTETVRQAFNSTAPESKCAVEKDSLRKHWSRSVPTCQDKTSLT
jgi:hypothetical protein